MRVLARAFVVLAAAAAVATGCGATGISESDQVSTGKTLFQENCQQCHALRDAGSTAVTGPDLDAAFRRSRKDGIPQSTIEQVVRGQIAYPAPPMPANLVEGEDAAAVAAYVAEVAATDVRVTAAPATPQDQGGGDETTAGGTGTGGGTETGGAGAGGNAEARSLFKANCAACHVLEDAGTTGTAGPNLDEAKPAEDAAAEQIENGGGGMPAFGDQLSDDQIRSLAEYIASVADK